MGQTEDAVKENPIRARNQQKTDYYRLVCESNDTEIIIWCQDKSTD